MILWYSLAYNVIITLAFAYQEKQFRSRVKAKLAAHVEKYNEMSKKWQTLVNGANEDFEAVINDLKKNRNELYELYIEAVRENRERKIKHAAAQAKHRAKKRAEREAAQAAAAKKTKGGKK